MAYIFTVLLLFLFFFNPLSSEAATGSALLASIDCGASQAYTDDLGIRWTPDSTLIKAGQAQTVAAASGTSVTRPLRTLRAFPSGKRNCYTIPVAGGGQVLVRATFYYGNYDGNKTPPTFDLEFDGNSWSTVHASADTWVVKEVIYAVSGGSTSVCVVQTTAGEVPFVSAIEVRTLAATMYKHYDRRSSALVLLSRSTVGSALVRYPNDPYDRIWDPFAGSDGLEVVKNEATSIETGIEDSPPAAILQAAITPASGSNIIRFQLSTALPPNTISINVYANLYFTEVTELTAGEIRIIQVFIDDIASEPLVPPYGGVTEIYMSNISVSTNTELTLRPTAESTLPPVISATEAFILVSVSGGSGEGTAAPALDAGDAAPANKPPASNGGSPSDSSSTTPSDSSTMPEDDQTNSTPADQKGPPGSAFGGGKKVQPSSGKKVELGRYVVLGVGMIVPFMLLQFCVK